MTTSILFLVLVIIWISFCTLVGLTHPFFNNTSPNINANDRVLGAILGFIGGVITGSISYILVYLLFFKFY